MDDERLRREGQLHGWMYMLLLMLQERLVQSADPDETAAWYRRYIIAYHRELDLPEPAKAQFLESASRMLERALSAALTTRRGP